MTGTSDEESESEGAAMSKWKYVWSFWFVINRF
jgi:hypothetical protein